MLYHAHALLCALQIHIYGLRCLYKTTRPSGDIPLDHDHENLLLHHHLHHDCHHHDHLLITNIRYDLVQTKVTFLMFFTVPAAIFVTSCLILFICSNVVRISSTFDLYFLTFGLYIPDLCSQVCPAMQFSICLRFVCEIKRFGE